MKKKLFDIVKVEIIYYAIQSETMLNVTFDRVTVSDSIFPILLYILYISILFLYRVAVSNSISVTQIFLYF